MRQSPYTTLLLDNDGVLVDSEGLSYQAFAAGFAELGKKFSKQDYRSLILEQGLHLKDLLKQFDIKPQEQHVLLERIGHHFVKELEEHCQLMPLVQDNLLKLHRAFRLVVVTGATRSQFEAAHANKNTLKLFERVFTLEDYPKAKPDPAPYLTALKALNLKPEECLVVEDTKRGLVAARAAGIDCAIIPNQLTNGHDFSDAKWILKDFGELAQKLLA